ncbi:MAG: hypothetical protein CV080_01505 [Candidatus Kuenenia stuttgartiensis]|nr:MAG: hypothetical protein CV080_01505 [Candidatus Kuenenia stuttgartiensis]
MKNVLQTRRKPKNDGGFGSCGCGCRPFFRRFISTKEEQEMLEEYSDQLKKELAGAAERIKLKLQRGAGKC